MLQAMAGDCPVDTHLGVIVAGDTLPRPGSTVAGLPGARPPAHLPPLRRTVETDLHGVRIVDGDRPARGGRPIDAAPEGQRVRIRWELMYVRRNKIGDAYPDFISLPPRVDIHHPSGGLHVIPLAQR